MPVADDIDDRVFSTLQIARNHWVFRMLPLLDQLEKLGGRLRSRLEIFGVDERLKRIAVQVRLLNVFKTCSRDSSVSKASLRDRLAIWHPSLIGRILFVNLLIVGWVLKDILELILTPIQLELVFFVNVAIVNLQLTLLSPFPGIGSVQITALLALKFLNNIIAA